VYIPFGGNRVGKFRMYLNLWIVFILTGIWHGNTWNFVIWGIWHGMFNCIEKMIGDKRDVKVKIIQHIYCLLIVIIGWVIFKSPSLQYSIDYIKNMFGLLQNVKSQHYINYYLDGINIIVFMFAVLCMFPIFKNWKESNNILINLYLILLLIVSLSFIAASTYQSFLYFQF
jgi:alginate O-acetyltransferase complex protein AlgI